MFYEIADCIDKPRTTYATTLQEAKMTAERLFAGIENIITLQDSNACWYIYNDKQEHVGNIWRYKGKLPI